MKHECAAIGKPLKQKIHRSLVRTEALALLVHGTIGCVVYLRLHFVFPGRRISCFQAGHRMHGDRQGWMTSN